VLNGGIEASRLAQPEMVTAQHRPRMVGIPGPRARMPGAVSLYRFQPTDQIPGGGTHGSRTRQRIRLGQVQPAHGAGAGLRLGLNLNEIVLTGE
jgi:hypothetical protein